MKLSVKKEQYKTIRPRTFVEMRASFSVAASDVLDILLYMIDKELKKDKTSIREEYIIETDDYVGLFYNRKEEIMSSKRVYEHIKNGIDEISTTMISFTEDTDSIKKGVAFPILTRKSWNSGTGKLGVKINSDFLNILKSQFGTPGYALYDLQQQFLLQTNYSKRLYPMLLRYKKFGTRKDDFSELREKIGIPDCYSQGRYLGIIKNSVQEINQKTNLSVEYKTTEKNISGGKKIENIEFLFTEKESQKKYNAAKHKSLKSILGDIVPEDEYEKIYVIADGDIDKIKQAKEIALGYNKKINSYSAFIISAIKGDWTNNKETPQYKKFMHSDKEETDLERELLSN